MAKLARLVADHPMTHAALYVRVSTREQTVANQELELRRWAEGLASVAGLCPPTSCKTAFLKVTKLYRTDDPTTEIAALAGIALAFVTVAGSQFWRVVGMVKDRLTAAYGNSDQGYECKRSSGASQ